MYLLIEQLFGIRGYGIKIFFCLLKLYTSYTVTIAIIFNFFRIYIPYSIIIITRRRYPHLYISAYALNQLIRDLSIFVFKYVTGGLWVIFFVFFKKLKENFIEDILEFINREVMFNQSKMCIEILIFVLVLHYIDYSYEVIGRSLIFKIFPCFACRQL